MPLAIREKLDNFFYNRLVRPLIFTSRLGRKTMFGYADTGINFDHIYKNVAKGYTPFGKFVDRILLNLPAAKATRYRKDKINKILRKEVEKNISQGKKTRIVDFASGPSRYLVDFVTKDIEGHVEALCFDLDRHSLDYGKKIAEGKPILYKRADVLRIGGHHWHFAEKKHWQPNIIVSSGLYEYLDDASAIKILKTIKNSLGAEGLLLLITQRDSPNRKLIEKVGITRSGKKWILFYREPEEITAWLKDIGYHDIGYEIDPWRMYVFFKGRNLS